MFRTCRAVAATMLPLVAVVGLAACSSTSSTTELEPGVLEADCDVEGVTEAAHHLLDESDLILAAVDDLRCAEGWSVITVTQSGEGVPTESATFVFRETEFGWVLKAPEIVCGGGPETLPPALSAGIC